MLKDMKSILNRSPKTLIGDAVGALAIGLMMTLALHLPSVF